MLAFPKPKDLQTFPANAKEKGSIREQRWLLDKGRCVDCGGRAVIGRSITCALDALTAT